MKYKIISKLRLFFLFSLMLLGASCSQTQSQTETQSTPDNDQGISLLATTTMLQDLATVIGGEHIQVTGLMTVGVDPHVYEPSAKDVSLLEESQVILYHGLHLEGKMTDIFEQMSQTDKTILSVEEALPQNKLLVDEDDPNSYDPHIWFDPSLWAEVATYLAQGLSTLDPSNEGVYQSNLEAYLDELTLLEEEIWAEIEKVPAESRVLITAHDAFRYFGERYDFQVMGIQGTATNSEATTQDMSQLADFIVDHSIKAIFVESSVSSKNIQALQEAVQAQGFQVELGGELYSDSLGQGEHSSYLNTYLANIHTITQALQGGEQ